MPRWGATRPYVVRFVSKGSGAGKTFVASRVVENLVKRGFSVGVIKHAASGVSLEEKDSKRYLEAGARTVAVASKELTIVYTRELADDLVELLKSMDKPLVIVEGFKGARTGDVVVVASSREEAADLVTPSTIAVVITDSSSRTDPAMGETLVVTPDRVSEVADKIVERARSFLLSQLPGRNCGACGFESCEALVLKILRGERLACPLILQVKLVVNGFEVELNPFVKSLMTSVVEGLLRCLKNVPRDVREVRLEIVKA